MAAKLLAEFEDFYQPGGTGVTQENGGSIVKAAISLQVAVGGITARDDLKVGEQDADDFGDFESYEVSSKDEDIPSGYIPRPVAQQPVPKTRNKPKAATQRDENVLFDADEDLDEGVDEGFGDFESTTTFTAGPSHNIGPGPVVLAPQHISLIAFDDAPSINAKSRAIQPSTSTLDAEHAYEGPTNTQLQSQVSKDIPSMASMCEQKQAPETIDDSAWDTFNEATPSLQVSSDLAIDQQPPTVSNPTDLWPRVFDSEPPRSHQSDADLRLSFDAVLLPLSKLKPDIPPSYIPPPALLLSHLSTIANTAFKQFFSPLSRQASEVRDQYLSQTEAQQYLREVLETAVVLARVVAGRKLRWKRDKYLAQSMRIGPASASGKSGGMKLTGLDKAEGAREDRDVELAVRSWKSQSGRIKSSAISAGVMPSLPDISESHVVRLASASEGAVSSPKPCSLCGLKRNERVVKVDSEVQDSFGEWWTEHWGHNDCIRFWETQKESMKA